MSEPKKTMYNVFISLGSNIDPQINFSKTFSILQSKFTNFQLSKIYRTKALDKFGMIASQPDYLNAVIMIRTELLYQELKLTLRDIEKQLHRIRTQDKYHSRTIDLDILIYNDQVIYEEGKIICPDPELINQLHLIIPFCDIAPNFIHPIFQQSMKSLRDELIAKSSELIVEVDLQL